MILSHEQVLISLWLQDHEVGFFGGVRWGRSSGNFGGRLCTLLGTVHNLIGLKSLGGNQSQSAVYHLRLSA